MWHLSAGLAAVVELQIFFCALAEKNQLQVSTIFTYPRPRIRLRAFTAESARKNAASLLNFQLNEMGISILGSAELSRGVWQYIKIQLFL